MGAGNGCLDRRVHTADAVSDTVRNVGVPEQVCAEPVSAWTALLLSWLVFQHGQISGTSVEVHREDARLIPSFPSINSCLMPAFMWLGVWSLGHSPTVCSILMECSRVCGFILACFPRQVKINEHSSDQNITADQNQTLLGRVSMAMTCHPLHGI